MAIRTVNWLSGTTYSPEQDRSLIDGIMTTPGVDTHRSFFVSQSPTPNMRATVSSGGAFVPGTRVAHQGQYYIYNDGNVTVEFEPSDPNNNRIDLISLVVMDAQYTQVQPSTARIVVTRGVPAGSPVRPLSPPDSIDLATALVKKKATAVSSADIQNISPRATALGGIAYARNYQELTEGLPRIEGLHAYRKDIDRLMVCDGVSWKYVNTRPSTDTGWMNINVPSKYQANKTQYRAYGDLVFTRGAIKDFQNIKSNVKKFAVVATMDKNYAPPYTVQLVTAVNTGTHQGVTFNTDGRITVYTPYVSKAWSYINTSWLR